jgi:asparagine synthase (glutamine-hydrolysing)
MTKVDIASMAHSLEVRQPFLDYRLVEFAASLPIGLKFQWGRGKRLLRQAFGDLLPESIWKRPKMGFGVPIDRWFRHELRELTHDVLLDASAQNREFFRPEVVQEMVQQHETGQADHAYRLWTLLMFELWLRRWGGRAVGKSELDR